jgi:tellurite resistance protein
MKHPTPAYAEASAHALAMIVASNGRVDEQELRALDQLGAFRRLGVSRERFVELARACVRDVGAQLCERSWLCADHLLYIDALLDAVPDAESRMLVCRLAAAVVTADGHVSDDERLVYDHALARWHISHAGVTEAILHDPVR